MQNDFNKARLLEMRSRIEVRSNQQGVFQRNNPKVLVAKLETAPTSSAKRTSASVPGGPRLPLTVRSTDRVFVSTTNRFAFIDRCLDASFRLNSPCKTDNHLNDSFWIQYMSDPIQAEIAKAISSTVGAPLSELSQLVADKIRYLRWKNAVTTLEKARAFAAQSPEQLSAPPLKFFLPFMEGCSLEESEADLTNEWARLLNTASIQYRSNQLIFTRILREIGSLEAQMMEKICSNDSSVDTGGLNSIYESIGLFDEELPSRVQRRIAEVVSEPIPLEDFKKVWEKVAENLRNPFSTEGATILEASIAPEKPSEFGSSVSIFHYDDGSYGKFGEVESLRACDILAFHRLIDVRRSLIDIGKFVTDSELSIFIVGCSVTGLGADFCMACIAKEDAT